MAARGVVSSGRRQAGTLLRLVTVDEVRTVARKVAEGRGFDSMLGGVSSLGRLRLQIGCGNAGQQNGLTVGKLGY